MKFHAVLLYGIESESAIDHVTKLDEHFGLCEDITNWVINLLLP